MQSLTVDAPEKVSSMALAASETKTYTTIQATVKDGKIILADDVILPDNTAILITILDKVSNGPAAIDNEDNEFDPESMTLGEHLIAAYEDMAAGRYTSVKTKEELMQYFDSLMEND